MLQSSSVRRALRFSLALNISFLIYLIFYSPLEQLSGRSYPRELTHSGFSSNVESNSFCSNVELIPMARSSLVEGDFRLVLSNKFRFLTSKNVDSKAFRSVVERFRKYFSALTRLSTVEQLQSSTKKLDSNEILLDLSSFDPSKTEEFPSLNEIESYRLIVNENGAKIEAVSLTGFVRGLTSFLQLIQFDASKRNSFLPKIQIEDSPRFSWRGLMIDVCRHWIPIEVLQRTIDAMELSKLNVLHLHLSDDQAFRMESRRFPLLHDRNKFFSQQEMKDLIQYAKQRRVRIVPEFDIPGHTTSWFVGYPDLTSEQGPFQVETRWGVMQPTMDPTRNSTYEFLNEFFKEMTEIFPDRYFHIGGDEVEGSQWARSPLIQDFINRNNLQTKNGLQSYFNLRVQSLLEKYQKTLIGWEEIIEESVTNISLSSEVIIQSWKNRKSVYEAIKRGYRAILSHGYYLDHLSSSSFHYKTSPISDEEIWLFSEEELGRILGGEACMWTEYADEETIDSRVWPRVLAVAERLWSWRKSDDESFLYKRLFNFSRFLQRVNIGLKHWVPSFRRRIENLIDDPQQRREFLQPLLILGKVCEATGYSQRSQTNFYNSAVPLTTFTDALLCESETVWKLETSTIRNETFFPIFQSWSLNHVRLRVLFENVQTAKNRQTWIQNVEQVSRNLAHVGRIGLAALLYAEKRRFHPDPSNDANRVDLQQWIGQNRMNLMQMEFQVPEVRLAAIRPVLRLFNSLEKLI